MLITHQPSVHHSDISSLLTSLVTLYSHDEPQTITMRYTLYHSVRVLLLL